MTVALACHEAFFRAAGIAVAAALLARLCRRVVAGPPGAARTGAWILLLVPFLTPLFLAGYAYGGVAVLFLRLPRLKMLFY
ncbi:MAG: hypothetical protein V1918_10540, partial [Planctomycetota bacterium]